MDKMGYVVYFLSVLLIVLVEFIVTFLTIETVEHWALWFDTLMFELLNLDVTCLLESSGYEAIQLSWWHDNYALSVCDQGVITGYLTYESYDSLISWIY